MAEHIIQLGINIDDEAVQKAVIHDASRMIVDEIKEDIYKSLPRDYAQRIKWNDLYEQVLDELLKDNTFRETVIEVASEKLVESIKRTKAWKEKVSEVME